MRGGRYEQDMEDMDAKPTAEMALKYKDIVVGVKTRALHRTGMDARRPGD